MSGGRFDYKQYEIAYIADAIQHVIETNGVKRERKDSWESEYYYEYSDDIITHFKDAVAILHKAQIYVQRIDWLLSSDDGEDSFRHRLVEDLNKLKYEREL